MCVHFHRFAPVVPAQNPALRASCQGGGCPPLDPHRCFGLLWPYDSEAPRRAPRGGWGRPSPPLGAAGAGPAGRRKSAGRFLALWPAATTAAALGRASVVSLPGRQGLPLALGSGAGVKLPGNNLKQPRGAESARCCFKTFPNCCPKVSFSFPGGNGGEVPGEKPSPVLAQLRCRI